ncbi:MAG: hypothetical protein COB20_06590 [SAR86 cluster bacterium]|uniref:Uncharacterized protein n=1 Tax=SAR86 cluster bacterium TaxID=2030880 RepID=A0A2A4X861_9GAMM|nr:MAG: hypothetical protein COB20_06590 [SAR86 cluster bacterium]
MNSTMTDMTVNSNPYTRLHTPASLHPNQSSVAVELGLDVAKLGSAEAVVGAIESALGKTAEEECARWFAISVLKHLRKAKWATPSGSDLDDVRQKSLGKDCLAVEGFSSSLRTVTKDARSKFRIVGFASSKKIERGVLATGTKAYKIAAKQIREAGLVERQAQQTGNKTASRKKAESQPPELREVEKTVVGRRAKRRGYFEDEFINVAEPAELTSETNQAVSMSKEEFADLDAALSKNDAEIIQKNWGDQQNEDRWSRILGLLAGVGFFVFVALLFL